MFSQSSRQSAPSSFQSKCSSVKFERFRQGAKIRMPKPVILFPLRFKVVIVGLSLRNYAKSSQPSSPTKLSFRSKEEYPFDAKNLFRSLDCIDSEGGFV